MVSLHCVHELTSAAPAWQRLRTTCGPIAEWLRICHRQGWLGSARRGADPPPPAASDPF
jgi:hypothetical protein